MCCLAGLKPGLIQFSQSNTHIYESDLDLAASLLDEPETGKYYLRDFGYDKDTLKVNSETKLADYEGETKKLPSRKLGGSLDVGEIDSYNL